MNVLRGARAGLALALIASAACGGKGARAPVGTDDTPKPAAAPRSAPENPVAGYMVASVGDRTLGPFFARHGSGEGSAGLVAWVTVAEGAGRRILTVPVGPKGAPRGAESVAAFVSLETTTLVVRPMRGPSPGFLLAWTSLTDRGKSLWTVAVGDDGMPRSKPVELTRTNDDIVWIDVVPTDLGALCLWAEETRGNDANLIAAPIDGSGKVRSAPTRVARGIVGWHALELPGGVGVSTVEPAPADPKAAAGPSRLVHEARPGGTLSFRRLDLDGHAAAAPITISSRPNVSGDVEVARGGERLVFAWTDRSTNDPALTVAALDVKDGKNDVLPPRRVIEPQGGASLLALAGGPAGVAVMFEAPVRRKGEKRRAHVAHVEPSLALGRPFSIELVGRGQPELAATTSGFAALATTANCEQDSTACLNADAVATVYRLDANAALSQREPLTFLADPATLGWSMTCDDETCFTLAASPGPAGSPSRVRTVAVRPRPSAKVAIAKPAQASTPPSNGPRVVDVTAVLTGESVLDIASTSFGNAHVVATLSTSPALGARRGGGGEATLATRMIDESGAPQPPTILSTRALPASGVAIARGATPADGGAIAWVARDNGDPEVHVTRIDKRGRKVADLQLTTTKGDATDVTITWAGGGWIVAWVDGRDGNGEVYATKVSADLARVAREERITKAPGDASDLVAVAHGETVLLAWADPRESPKDGVADVFVSAVSARDAKRAMDEHRLLSTAAHSRTPHLASGPDGVYIAWIEEAPMGSATPGASGFGAFWAKLDDGARPTDKPVRIPLAGEGAATSVTLDASPALHAVVARSTPDALVLDAADLSTPSTAAAPLITLDGPPSLDVALVLEGGVLYFNDEGPQVADRRARRARIAWQIP